MVDLKNSLKRWLIPQGFIDLLATANADKERILFSREERSLLQENRQLKDRHKGQRCFILGAGSSINNQDLTKLAGEVVLSVSNVFVHPAIPVIRPSYHILPPVFQAHGQFNSVAEIMGWFAEMEEKTFAAEMFFHIGDRKKIQEYGLYKNRTVHWLDYTYWNEISSPEIDLARIPNIWSVSETAITIAVYLGFEEIYLLGFDHDWFNGPLVYFYDAQKEHKLQPSKDKIPFADSEFQMKRHAYIFRKYKYLFSLRRNIYNANADPGSYVDIFPKVDYDSLFPAARQDCR